MKILSTSHVSGDLNISGLIKSQLIAGSIPASWDGTSAPYTITVTISGVTATHDYIVQLLMDASTTTAQRLAWNAAAIKGTAQTTGSMTFAADGIKPTIALPIQIKSI